MAPEGTAMRHLGMVLFILSDLHPDDRCQALDEALAFYNAANPDEKIEPSGAVMQRLVFETQL